MQGFFNKHGSKLALGLAGAGVVSYAIHKGYQINQNGRNTIFSPPAKSKTQQEIEDVKVKEFIHAENIGSDPYQKLKGVSSEGSGRFINREHPEEKHENRPS